MGSNSTRESGKDAAFVGSSGSGRQFTVGQARLGTVLFVTGCLVLLLSVWSNSAGSLPWPMPGIWHSQRAFCLMVAFAIAIIGGYVMWHGPRDVGSSSASATVWRPAKVGRRFCSLVVYSREHCPLCDEAVELLQHYAAYLPVIQEVDIDRDPELQMRWTSWVPVVELDGKVRFKGRVSEMLLRRLIEGTPPS